MDAIQQYKYQVLTEQKGLRLFELFPSNSGDPRWGGGGPLRGSILHTSIDDSTVTYEALSYRWGDATTPAKIEIQQEFGGSSNDVQFLEITESLQQALSLLRLPTKSRVLWIDAVCINQRDFQERNIVVSQMRTIYARAERAVICLGREWFNSDYVPQAIMGINSALADGDQATGFSNLDRKMQSIINSRPAPHNIPRDPAYMWENLRSWLYDRKWFLRVWVIQEAAVARSSIVVCGNWELPGKAFFQTLGELNKHVLPPSISQVVDGYDVGVNAALQQIGLMASLGAAEKDHHPRRLLDLLQQSRGAAATDPHDRIYALFGLASDIGDATPRIDYVEPWQQTYVRFARYFISQGFLRDVLLNCFSHPSNDEELPSWVPNWAVVESIHGDRPKMQIPHFAPSIVASSYNAGGDLIAAHEYIEDKPQVLGVRGHLLMKIEKLGKVWSEPLWTEPPSVTSKLLLEVHEELRDYCRGLTEDINMIDHMSWRTLVCDQHWHINRPIQPGDMKMFYLFALRCAKLLDCDLTVRPPKEIPSSHRGMALRDSLPNGDVKNAALEMMFKFGDPTMRDAQAWKAKAMKFCTGNRRCVTNAGLVGQVPLDAKTGDMIAIFEGVPVPFVLRTSGEATRSSQYRIIGACYFLPLMMGQSLNVLQGQGTSVMIQLI